MVELDEQTFKRLEQVTLDSSSRRSDFIRGAVRRALWELEEQNAGFSEDSQSDAELFLSAVRASANPPKAEKRAPKRTRRRATR